MAEQSLMIAPQKCFEKMAALCTMKSRPWIIYYLNQISFSSFLYLFVSDLFCMYLFCMYFVCICFCLFFFSVVLLVLFMLLCCCCYFLTSLLLCYFCFCDFAVHDFYFLWFFLLLFMFFCVIWVLMKSNMILERVGFYIYFRGSLSVR